MSAGIASARNAAAQVAILWHEALDRSYHPACCACCGSPVVSINPSHLKEDVLFYLSARYRSDLPELLPLLDGAATLSLPQWLAERAEWAEPAIAESVANDVAQVLRGIGRGAGEESGR